MGKPSFANTFENNIALTSLKISLVPLLILISVMFFSDISIYLKIIITILCSTTVAIGNLIIWRKVRNQLRTSTNIIEAIVLGDTTMRASSKIKQGALAELNTVINGAVDMLAEQRLVSKEHHIAMSKVLEHIPVAVLCIDHNRVITLINPMAQRLFDVTADHIDMPIKSLGIGNEVLDENRQQIVELNTTVSKKVYLHTESYRLHGKEQQLIFINDVEKLLQNEERNAWQRLLRVLSHEINNSLAPIASIGESLSALTQSAELDDETKQELTGGLAIVTERALSLNHFIREYQNLARLPTPVKAPFAIKPFIDKHIELFPEFSHVSTKGQELAVYADEEQLSQVFVNLLKNAFQASSKDKHLNIHWFTIGNVLHISIEDNGQGIANTDNLFVPFYTTKPNGSGIGLVLSRQIMFNHSGNLTLANKDVGQGAVATLSLPTHSSTHQ